ncbi:LTA synthase family protein [Flavobacterium aciduliphilum]|uniref:Phosphoglycerol transferase MdoB-like AlkP superfamily enzyme n=1 Tax=Flavobacterium aciduliphilum TaxID=1101402 RepID=A0A328YTN5_9FLAO|nr:alkaline phosphatase family protein [Flavobacterium aciduliphilum]RAR73917.1 phosphoglycerol transferase MdoB-like AlkP superfamily enzyme [Flavobacterium aciduliphilum]
MYFFQKKSPIYQLGIFYLLVNFIIRIVLFFHPITQSHFSIIDGIKIIFLGAVSDLFVYFVASVFLWLYLLFLSNKKYDKPWGYVIFGLHLSILLYIISGKSILHEYGGSLPEIGLAFVGLKTFLFGLLLFLPAYRKNIRKILYSLCIFIFVLVIIQNAISEFFFWNEFGVRYNFIAVDYLVYTNTVIGNIMESYPVVPLFTSVGIFAILVTFFVVKKTKSFLDKLPSFSEKIKNLIAYSFLFLLSLWAIPSLSKLQNSNNVFTNELQANGIYKFYTAFMNSELDFYKFYKTIPETEAYSIVKKQLVGLSSKDATRTVNDSLPEIHKNVVLITIESYSADFLKAYGNQQNITPFIDELAQKSLQFTNLYAVGNRTVRGLEAVTLCFPPTAGESIIKRVDNKNKFSTGALFKKRGYAVKFLYGGDAYFDNMGDFFGGNGYDLVDKKSFKPNEITFSNIWGVCDEDMAHKAIATMNAEYQTGKPFFNHWMTVSNHRPFTYPDGKIDIDAHSKSREGGVKYTDYALRKFFSMAAQQPWFKNTVFVVVADHCASSSGKTELPLDKYRIPAMIYAPGFITPGECTKLMSQIDLMPTLMGMLHFQYKSKFYGQDVFKSDYQPRAFIATYQDLGLIKDQVLTIISPVKKVKQFDLVGINTKGISPNFQILYEEKPVTKERTDLIRETIAYYQSASYLLKNKKYQK